METQVIYTRLPKDLHMKAKRYVVTERKRRLGSYSYTTFLAEAVSEKLTREGKDYAKDKEGNGRKTGPSGG